MNEALTSPEGTRLSNNPVCWDFYAQAVLSGSPLWLWHDPHSLIGDKIEGSARECAISIFAVKCLFAMDERLGGTREKKRKRYTRKEPAQQRQTRSRRKK